MVSYYKFEETFGPKNTYWARPAKGIFMKTIFTRLFAVIGLSSLFSQMAFASNTSAIPGVNTFVDILIGLAGGKVGLFLIVIIVGFSAYNAWKNANIAALIWGLFASIVLAVLVPYASSILEWAKGLTF